MPEIYGNLTDRFGRCIHYHQDTDIVATKCSYCDRFYACYRCHDEQEKHSFTPIIVNDLEHPATVLCGNCQKEVLYKDYQRQKACVYCQHLFNPKCSLHHSIYFSLKNV